MAKKKGGKKRHQRSSSAAKPSAPSGSGKPAEAEQEKASEDDAIDEPDDDGADGGDEDAEHPEKDEEPKELPVAAKGSTPAAAAADRPMPAWVKPFVKVDKGWSWFEERLLVLVVLGLMLVMGAWVVMRGMQEPVAASGKAGVVLRAMLGMIVLGPISWLATKKLGWDLRRRTGAVVASLALAALLAPAWRDAGVDYFGHMFNWLQEGSSLTLFGQLRGVSTRLTVLLAMIGASLAAAGGKHINIDAFLRFVPKRLLLPTFVASSIATAAVCFAAAWGFFENIAINNFGAEREWKYDKKIEIVEKRVAQDLFIWRLQIGFDLESLPIVLGGGKWDDESRLNGKQWNELVESSGYRDHFTKEQVDALLAPPEALGESRLPMVVVPDNSPRGLLVHTMNLTFPIGFVIVGLRFLLRLILVLAGVETLDPDVAGISDEKPDARPKAGAAAEEKA